MKRIPFRKRNSIKSFRPFLEYLEDRVVPDATPYAAFGANNQHTGLSSVASQAMESIHWYTTVDNFPTTRFAHYGSPLITLANTVIYPFKTANTASQPNGAFHLVARNGNDGALLWDVTTDWVPSGYNWYPAYQPVYVPASGRVYFSGANGSLYFVDNVDAASPSKVKTQVTVFGTSGNVAVTGLTADAAGNIYFGYRNGTVGGIAKVSSTGVVTTVSANTASQDAGFTDWIPQFNQTPALSNNEQTLYVTLRRNATSNYGRLVGLSTATLSTQYNSGVLKDPRVKDANGNPITQNNAGLLNDSTASPMVAPDGHVFLGVFGVPYNGSRGWMAHFNADLTMLNTSTPDPTDTYVYGGFGWDTTPSVVPASMVPGYSGPSSYLIFTKYNNYYGPSDGGDGQNAIAILDPLQTEVEFHASSQGLLVMKRLMVQVGPTPDWDFPGVPTARREWCINTGAVDPFTDSIIVNSADGKFYRWDLATNALVQPVDLTTGFGQPYTMTVIGVDGTIYGMQNGKMFALGQTPRASVSDVIITEGTGGTTTATFTVSLNYPRTTGPGLPASATTINYATADGSAVEGVDYTAVSGTLTYAAGEKTKTVTVTINPDALNEINETFFLNLSSPSNLVVLDGQGQATLNNDDPQPTISITDVSANEGNGGSSNFDFTVTLSAASGQTVTLNYATDSGSANPADYQPTSGSLTFNPGETTKTVTVVVDGDTVFESTEEFLVNLSGVINAAFVDSQGVGTIVNDDDVPSISVNDGSITEGGSITFTVSLSNPSSQTITVDYATSNGTAGGSDYTGGSGTFTFAPGEVSKTVVIATLEDSLNELTETFLVLLTNPTNAFVSDGSGQGDILDNDPQPSLSIADILAFEGVSGTSAFGFTVTLSAVSGRTVTVDFTSADGTATAPGDYQALSGSVTFNAGEISKTISILVNGDFINEPDETFVVNLSNPSGATIAGGQATGTILNDDALVLSVDSVSHSEGDSGATDYTFTVSLSTPSSQTVTVDYATADGSATAAGGDYQAGAGTVTFLPGETTGSFTVQANGDTLNETDEAFFVNLSNPSGGTIGAGQGQATIVNDDPPPTLSVSDLNTPEGDYNNDGVVVYVSLSAASGQTVTVTWDLLNGTAASTSATRDYIDDTGALTFAPGETVKPIIVQIIGDTRVEIDETIRVLLTTPTNATIADDEAIITILNDDTAYVTINGASVTEGNGGFATVDVTVTLSTVVDYDIFIDFETEDASALAGADYVAQSGTLTFVASETSKTITLQVNGDLVDELDEAFEVVLSGYNHNVVLGSYPEADVDIIDDDTAGISIDDVTVTEGNSGTVAADFTISLSTPSDRTVTVDFATADGSASAGVDYQGGAGTLTFLPGETSKTVTVLVNGDAVDEADETFFVNLSSATGGATIDDAQAQGAILDDDTAAISISDASVTEGNSGTVAAAFTVSLSTAADHDITVNYATTNGSASAGSDYQAGSGTVTFAAGVTSQTVNVLVNGDTLDESDETYFVNLSGATGGATIADAQGQGTIVDDDTSSISINDVSVTEGNSGTLSASFTVSLSTAADHTVTVNYATATGSATAGSDYQTGSGIVTFAAGVTTQTVSVLINGDTLDESNETFFVNLSIPSGGVLSDAQGQGTIVDNDTAGIVINDVSVTEGSSGTVSATFTVSLTIAADHTVGASFATANGTATAGSDYAAASGAVSFAPGVTTQTVSVLVNGDIAVEGTETFFVNLSTPTGGATISDVQGQGTIVNDDTATLSINDVSLTEGNTGFKSFVFTVTLSATSTQTITVQYATANGTATTANNDYTATSGTLTFTPGQFSKAVSVNVKGDKKAEPNETFFVNLSNAVNAVIGDSQGQGTIVNDDGGAFAAIVEGSRTAAATPIPTGPALTAPSTGQGSTPPAHTAVIDTLFSSPISDQLGTIMTRGQRNPAGLWTSANSTLAALAEEDLATV